MESINENDELETESETEGIINNIPNSINLSNKFQTESSPKHFRQYSLTLNSLNIPTVLSAKDFKNNDNFNNTVRLDKYKYQLKFEDSNSTATKSSINDKLKKVTFSTVEIIRVKNYKKYNRLNSIKKNENNNGLLTEDNCSIF